MDDAPEASSLRKLVKDSRTVRIAMPLIVISFTALRLYFRGRRRWGSDDALVCLGCIWLTAHMAIGLVVTAHYGEESRLLRALFYASYLVTLTILLFARLSISLSIARITPWRTARRRREQLSIGFVIFYIVEFGIVAHPCFPDTTWDQGSHAQKCFRSQLVQISHLISSVLSDTPLLILPVMTLRALKKSAPRVQTRMTLAFLASACTTAISVATSLLALINLSIGGGYLPAFEAYSSLLFCSIPVLVVAACRLLRVRNLTHCDERTLPPMQFAAGPKKENVTTDLPTLSSVDVTPFTSDRNYFPGVVRPFPATPLSWHTTSKSTNDSAEHTNYLSKYLQPLGFMRVVGSDDDQEWEEEMKVFQEREKFETEFKDLDDGSRTIRHYASGLPLRRHSI